MTENDDYVAAATVDRWPFRDDGHHRVEWWLNAGDDHPEIAFMCDAPADAECRTYCPESACEEGCVAPDQHTRVSHGDYCNYREWLADDGLVSTYDGPRTTIRNGRVAVAWTGDYYLWRYSE